MSSPTRLKVAAVGTGISGLSDAGFVILNPVTSPNFVELLQVLGVESRASDMSFAMSLEGGPILRTRQSG